MPSSGWNYQKNASNNYIIASDDRSLFTIRSINVRYVQNKIMVEFGTKPSIDTVFYCVHRLHRHEWHHFGGIWGDPFDAKIENFYKYKHLFKYFADVDINFLNKKLAWNKKLKLHQLQKKWNG